MSNFVQLDKNRRKEYLRKLEKRNSLKKALKKMSSSDLDRYHLQIKLQKMSRNSLGIRIKNRCAITGRAKGLIGPFQLSRIKLRELVSQGLIPGVRKAIW